MIAGFVRADSSSTGLAPGQLVLHFDYALNILREHNRLPGVVSRRNDSRQLHPAMIAIDRYWISIGDSLVGQGSFHLSDDEGIVCALGGRIIVMRRGRLYGIALKFNGLSSGRGIRRRRLLRVNSDREDESRRHTASHGGYQFFVSHDWCVWRTRKSIPRAPVRISSRWSLCRFSFRWSDSA